MAVIYPKVSGIYVCTPCSKATGRRTVSECLSFSFCPLHYCAACITSIAFNNAKNSSTGSTPFYANYGYHPTFEPTLTSPVANPDAQSLADRLEHIRLELQAELRRAQDLQAAQFNKRALPAPALKPGDLVCVTIFSFSTLFSSIFP